VSDSIGAGRIFLREGTLLPEALKLESEPYIPGWRSVKNLDGRELGRKIHEAGWTFFCLAGEIHVTAFGFDEQKAVRRAIARILASPKSEKFNSLEIARVMSAPSRRFLGVTHVTLSARSRHIQESMFLLTAKNRSEQDLTLALPPDSKPRLGNGRSLPHAAAAFRKPAILVEEISE
jgi:hypothetical protein